MHRSCRNRDIVQKADQGALVFNRPIELLKLAANSFGSLSNGRLIRVAIPKARPTVPSADRNPLPWHHFAPYLLKMQGVPMNKLLILGTAIAFLVVGQLHCAAAESDNSSVGSSASAADEAAIRAIIDRQTDAWNRHDMDAFVADARPDVDWINVVGMHWKGREQ